VPGNVANLDEGLLWGAEEKKGVVLSTSEAKHTMMTGGITGPIAMDRKT
jgi:hypothetical protein